MADGCDVIAAVAGEFPTISKEKLTISIHYAHGDQRIDTHWVGRDGGRWLWTLRNAGEGINKGYGYCETATDALKMAFAAASFVIGKIAPQPPLQREAVKPVEPPQEPPRQQPTEPVEVETVIAAATGRHYRDADVRFQRA